MNDEEKENMDRFKSEERKEDHVAGRNAAKKALEELGVFSPIILNDDMGRPYVKGDQNIGVSISHKNGDGYAIAWNDGTERGIDVEDVDLNIEIAQEVLNLEERELFGDNIDTYLSIIFSMKEAYLKAAGTGFHTPLAHVSVINIDLKAQSVEIEGPYGLAKGSYDFIDGRVRSVVSLFRQST